MMLIQLAENKALFDLTVDMMKLESFRKYVKKEASVWIEKIQILLNDPKFIEEAIDIMLDIIKSLDLSENNENMDKSFNDTMDEMFSNIQMKKAKKHEL